MSQFHDIELVYCKLHGCVVFDSNAKVHDPTHAHHRHYMLHTDVVERNSGDVVKLA